MDARTTSLPPELRRPVKGLRSAADRLVLWDRWELQQWVEATRSRGLAFLTLDAEVQRRIIAAIDEPIVPVAVAS
jgi:hypothetical protein